MPRAGNLPCQAAAGLELQMGCSPQSRVYLLERWSLRGWHQEAELWGDRRRCRSGGKGSFCACFLLKMSSFSTSVPKRWRTAIQRYFGGICFEPLQAALRLPSSGSGKRPEKPFHSTQMFSRLQVTGGPCSASGQGVKAPL